MWLPLFIISKGNSLKDRSYFLCDSLLELCRAIKSLDLPVNPEGRVGRPAFHGM